MGLESLHSAAASLEACGRSKIAALPEALELLLRRGCLIHTGEFNMFIFAQLVRCCAPALVVLATMAAVSPVLAQSDYPSKPIKVIIPFAPGGGTDITGRTVATKLAEAWSVPVLAENQAGANGTIGINMGSRAAPDGHTITLISTSTAINVHIYPKLNYDLLRDFTALSQLTSQPYLLVVHPSVQAKNIRELIALAKAKPGALNYGSSGIGGTSHLSGALLSTMAGVQMTHVPYKGGNPAMLDVVAGNIHMLFSTLLQSQSFLKDGRLRAIAISTAARSPAAPDVPTIAESGVPGYEVAPWYGLLLPARTPDPIIGKLSKEVMRIMRLPDVAPRMAADGSVAVGSTPEQFSALLKVETAKWGKVVKEAGITAE